MYTITQKQIDTILQVVYQTNISAQSFDNLKKFLEDLPLENEEEDIKKEENETTN